MLEQILGYEYLIDVKKKLESVLEALNQEHENNTEFYLRKISELYDEIADKEAIIGTLQLKLEENQKRIKALQQKANTKSCSRKKSSQCSHMHLCLHQATRTRQNIKANTSNYASQVFAQKTLKIDNHSIKKINISDYFLKLSDEIKTESKLQHKKRDNSTFQSFAQQIQPCRQTLGPQKRQNKAANFKITRRTIHYFSEIKDNNQGWHNSINTFTYKF